MIAGTSIVFISGCGSSEEIVDVTDTAQAAGYSNPNGYSTALLFHIQTTITDIESAMKTIDPTLWEYTINTVKYAGMTLTNAAKIAESDGKPEIAQKLKELDTRLKAICEKEWVSTEEFTTEITSIVDVLKTLIQ